MAEKTKQEFSAGGIVYKKENGKTLWLVCQHSGYHKWVFPKGIIEENERGAETALREVEEEVGIKAKIIGKIKEPERYVYKQDGVTIFKNVVYFLMEYVSGRIENHDKEMEAVEWLSYEQALKRLDFKGAQQVLQKAKKLLEEQEKQEKLF